MGRFVRIGLQSWQKVQNLPPIHFSQHFDMGVKNAEFYAGLISILKV